MLLNQAPAYLFFIVQASVTQYFSLSDSSKALHAIKQFGFSRKQIQPEFRVPDVYQGVVLESTPMQRRGQRQNWEEGEIQLRCMPDGCQPMVQGAQELEIEGRGGLPVWGRV